MMLMLVGNQLREKGSLSIRLAFNKGTKDMCDQPHDPDGGVDGREANEMLS